jgi:transposase
VRTLQGLVEERRKLVDRRTALANSLLAHLKHYFPQALALFGGALATSLACRFLQKWPSLARLQRASDQTLRQFFYAHNCRSESRLQQRLDLIRAAQPLTTDQAVLEVHQRGALSDVAQLSSLLNPIRDLERRIEQLMKQLPEAPLFEALPGAGPALAPRLAAAFGSDRARWQSAQEIQAFTGIAPVTIRSGKSSHVSWRWACPKFLRQTFHEFARCSLRQCAWAKAFYDMKRDQKHSRHAALRALAYKWIRILFRCWQANTPYDDARYIAALHHRNAPLLKYLTATSSAQNSDLPAVT